MTATRGGAPDGMELPVSICDIEESLAGWPYRKPRDEPEPEEDTSDWPDDHKLDDPRRGQAKWINR